MNQNTRKDIFVLLLQKGAFSTGDSPIPATAVSIQTKNWVRKLKNEGLTTKYRVLRNQIFEFLNVHSFAEIKDLIDDGQRRQEVSRRAYGLLANMFGIEGSEREIINAVNNYSRTADSAINYLRAKVLANYASHIELTNEIDSCKNPVDLLLILFDDRYHKKARFEAKRKLVLMNLAGSIEQRERETDVERKFSQFLDFLNQHVWSKKIKIGELESVYLLSSHDATTFACNTVTDIDRAPARGLQLQAGQKLTLIKRRRFLVNGREIPIYVSVRKKPPEAKVLKLLRKGEENPAVAVDDELGLMAVVESAGDVKTFQKHLTRSASEAGSFMTLEEISDTLAGGEHVSSSAGSSTKTPMFKFFARMGGMRVEFIVHTYKSYLNYMYQRGVSHDEYEIKRIFDSGVADLLFPRDIYEFDINGKKDALISWFRQRIEAF